LKKVLPDSVDVNGYVDLGSIELTGGDANGNNQIDSADLDIFSDNWGLVGQ